MKFEIENLNKNAIVTCTERVMAEGLIEQDLAVVFSEPTKPERVTLRFRVPCVDTYLIWTPQNSFQRALSPDWWWQVSQARLAAGAPIMTLLSKGGENRMTITHSDPNHKSKICAGLNEEHAEFRMELHFLIDPMNPITEYHTTLRFDTRKMRYDDAIMDVEKWWEERFGYTGAYVPDHAKLPMYSAWYSFHQALDPDALVYECERAKKLGMETIIIDDGWQTDNNERGYAFCGDWELATSKIPDMKELVDRIHRVGMKVMLWYSVPFVGIHSKAYSRFSTMLLDGPAENKDTFCLDPRFKEVREYLTGIYTTAVRNWGLDGLKLDFIDSFALTELSEKEDPRRDIASLEEALDTLLSEVTTALRRIDPDFLIEFRQGYIGPTIRKYGNMLRVGDCPDDPIHNRVGAVDLRLTSGKTAVHSDMIMWHKDDTPEEVATQLLSILFTVPQISVRVDNITEEQAAVLSHFLDFWKGNRDVLIESPIHAEDPDSNYSLVRAEKEDRIIALANVEKPLTLERIYRDVFFFNATGGESLLIRSAESLAGAKYTVYDCTGKRITSGMLTGGGVYDFDVPKGGMVNVHTER